MNDDTTRLGLGILVGTAAVAALPLFLRRRNAVLGGSFSTSVKKFKDKQGREDIAVVSWLLPPGPPPPQGVREGFREMCRAGGGTEGVLEVPNKPTLPKRKRMSEAYAWRVGAQRKNGKVVPDPKVLDTIRSFSSIRYPAEADPSGRTRPSREVFGLLLSADSQTGIPWIKDKQNRIMPVSFVLTRSDLATVDPETGNPAVLGWDDKIPGMILRDHSLRSLPRDGLTAFNDPSNKWCAAEVAAGDESAAEYDEEGKKIPKKKGKKSKEKSGCFSCGLCLPGTSQGAAELMFKRRVLAEQIASELDPDAQVDWERLKRSPDPSAPGETEEETLARLRRRREWEAANEAYEAWKADRTNTFTLAVPPSQLVEPEAVTEAQIRRMDTWLARRAKRIPLVGEKER